MSKDIPKELAQALANKGAASHAIKSVKEQKNK
ncbi:hypothetical protein OKW24_005261 [Peribacillus simplex]|nr:hypothetical protein [Peribacillus simplex]